MSRNSNPPRRPPLSPRPSTSAATGWKESWAKAASVWFIWPTTHRNRCRELLAQGYRPVALSVSERGAASLWHRPVVPDADKEHLAKRQANAAAALLRLKQPDKVWPLLKNRADPRVRSYLIHRLSPLGADAGAILKRFDEEPDITIHRALLLSLGEFGDKELPPDARKAFLPKLQSIYRTDADAGLHAAAEWLLRSWKQKDWLNQVNAEWAEQKTQRDKWLDGIRRLLAKDKEKTAPQWYVNNQGQTMVVIPGPVEFVMGSPRTEAEREGIESQHKMRINRTFAIAATAVKEEQYLRFGPGFSHTQFHLYPDPSCPIGGVIWYEAAAYCNWLSEQEGIDKEQWCYEIKNGQVTKLKENYLSLTGYRLPTEAEVEYATRAGALTSRYYGETEVLLSKYAWYLKNSQERTWPVGSLKPNDFGLFETHGIVYTRCQESYHPYPRNKGDVIDDKENTYSINIHISHVLRGGSFVNLASVVRSAYRAYYAPALRDLNLGFRPARTRKIKDPDVLWLANQIIDHSNPQEEVYNWFPGDDLFAPTERRTSSSLSAREFASWAAGCSPRTVY